MRLHDLTETLVQLFRRVNLQMRLLIALMVVTVIPTSLVGLIAYVGAHQALNRTSTAYATQQAHLLTRNVDATLAQYVTALNRIVTNIDFVRDVRNFSSIDGPDRYSTFRNVHSYINDATGAIPYFVTLEITNTHEMIANTQYRVTRHPLSRSEIAEKAFYSSGRFHWFGTTRFEYQGSTDDSYNSAALLVSREISNLTDGSTIGMAYLAFREDALYSVYRDFDFGGRGSIYVTDHSGVVISAADKSRIGTRDDPALTELTEWLGQERSDADSRDRTTTIQGESFLVASAPSEMTGWRIVALISRDHLMAQIKPVGLWIVLIVLVLSTLIFPISYAVTTSVTRPIHGIMHAMKAVERDDLSVAVAESGKDEIAFLEQSFNSMVGRIHRLIAEVYEVRLKQREAEFKALEAQINPHFLYNTLDMINWMAFMSGQRDISTMVESLSRFFRLSLNKGDEMCSIAQELDHVRSYITIQEMRYRQKIQFVVDADPECLDCKTIKVILQPLVENAIHHGIEPKEETGTVKVEVSRVDSTILMRVRDNGIGLGAASRMPKSREFDTHGYGVFNVDERIRLYFGEGWGLTLEEPPEGGTLATMKIPAVLWEGRSEHT